MRFSDMKKITVIASLLILFSACQKADIRPNTAVSEPTPEMKSISVDNPDETETVNNSGSLSSENSNDPNNPNNPNGGDSGGGDITDPLRKKDQKDNK